jgi:hypothetical protein
MWNDGIKTMEQMISKTKSPLHEGLSYIYLDLLYKTSKVLVVRHFLLTNTTWYIPGVSPSGNCQ